MRVRRMALRNFRTHRDTQVEVPDGVTAVVGPNGAGKSTLIEALLFAIYGTEAVRTSKHQVRWDGAPPGDAVRVEADLEVAGHAVAIVRELRGRTLVPWASLAIDGAVAVAPGAGSSEAASQRMADLLGMDCDAFLATLVARQGELARLGSQAPADRKRLVLRMMGVDRVDHAIERARQSRREAQSRLDGLRLLLADLAMLERALAQAEAAAEAAAAEARAQEAQRAAAAAALGRARADLAAAEQADARRRAIEQDLLLHRREGALREAALAGAQRAVAEAGQAAARAQALAPAAGQAAALQQQAAAAAHAQAAARSRAAQLAAIARMEAEADQAEAHLALVLQPLEPDAAGPDPAQLRGRLAHLDAELAVLRHREQAVVERALRLEGLKAAGAAGTARMEGTTEAAGTNGAAGATEAAGTTGVAGTTRTAEGGADAPREVPCPTCERPLGDHLPILLGRTKDQRIAIGQDLASLAAERGGVAAQLAHAERAAAQAADLRARAEQGRRRAVEARAALGPAAPAGDAAALRRAALEAQAASDERQRCLALAARLPGLRAQAAAEAGQLAASQAAAAAAQAALAALPPPAAALADARAALEAAAAAEAAAQRRHAAAAAAQAAAAERRGAAAARLAEERERHALAAAAEAEVRSWTALAGPQGGGLLDQFRDHLVDRIGPAIQAEAGRLLALFTGGRYGEVLLDSDYNVFVTDGGVPHAIERFSGGEADLVHLALRLSVSRLLAQRAGTADLRFLALDEVFGALDRSRRAMVVEALQGLGGLYQQVLVVSHLEHLQEALGHVLSVELQDGASSVRLAGA